ncbi:MAG: DUF4012 domain-containing protein [Acidimicrobiales bacterium]|nr:DUF4012 domain-containing protein [Acidimicrobiales bacterium]
MRDAAADGSQVNRLSPRARWALVAALAVGAYLVFCGVWLAMARREARAGSDQLAEFREDPDPQDLLDGTALPVIESAQRDFESARDRARSPLLAPLRMVPLLGRQIDSFATISGAAGEVAAAGVQGAQAAREALDGDIAPGAARVATLRELADIAEATSARLATIPLGPSSDLLGPVARGRDELAEEKDSVELALLYTRDAANALADILEGPSSYLVMAANNAEMRAGSGMFLSVGRVDFGDGRLQLAGFQPSGSLHLDVGVPYRDRDLKDLWGFAHPNREWRNLALSPRFPPNAEMATRMWAAAGEVEADGVLAIDVVGLQAFLRATGPVEVDGETVDADNVVQLLLHDQYTGDPDQSDRRDRLAEIARAVLEAFDGSSPDLPALAQALREAVEGRHLMLWSADTGRQRAWEQAGVSGAVGDHDVLVGLMNRGGNKLDQYQQVRGRVRTRRVAEGTVVSVRLTVTNEVPEGEPEYIAGEGEYGLYDGWLSLTMPGDSGLVDTTEADAVAAGPDGDSRVLAIPVVVSPGDTIEWRVAFVVPDDVTSVTVAPSARVPHIEWWGPDGLRWNDRDTPRQAVPLPPAG